MSDDSAGTRPPDAGRLVRARPGDQPVPAPRPATLAESDDSPAVVPHPGSMAEAEHSAALAPHPGSAAEAEHSAALTPHPGPAAGSAQPSAPAADLEPTGAWPAPDPAEFAEEDTDPTGFAPVAGLPYPPATDPFDDPGFTSAYPLPGWTAPPDLEPLPGTARRRKPVLLAAAALGLAGLIAAFLLVPRQDADAPRAAAATAAATTPAHRAANPPADNAPPGSQLTAPADGRTEASFDLLDSATLVELSAADLGDDLFRISTPPNSGLTPSAEQDHDAVRLRLRSDGSGGSAAVTIVLNAAVRWTLRLDGGVTHSRLDLTGADLAALDLNGGASRIDLSLPEPRGLVPVRMTGGVDQFRVTLPDTTPVRVRVESGAGQVTVGGTTHRGIAPGRSFTTRGWGTGDAGVDLQAVAGLSTLTVTN
ncbi:hypothetical protein ACTOB_002850 [Actinoplanes oblitus]|uniref:Adhesin domain-containing protein n=1 Tax=Actinoplanes oblitus TaxID=3040509 RepID=A0ABY8WMW2_9ACTN|nr:hypothetical protein [Actinoplanes oblitus]WIM99206.1 hypothetical protein ACTOB_002850 [Actinoplanes oblitus]